MPSVIAIYPTSASWRPTIPNRTAGPGGKCAAEQRESTKESGRMNNERELLRCAYRDFNARNIDAVISLMHPEVEWANGHGRRPRPWKG